MRTIKDFKYTPRNDYSVDIRDFLELLQYIQTLEEKISGIEARLRGKDFVEKLTNPQKESEGE